ncbi:hypothetical protein GA0074695_0312 [Micromonospora viridifaciens]|uniref:Uncharacterized protein n=1 Tax=Micromonospora viridifaciens TaxID=1881 RepID=A0A1C4UAQ8_MICVI|nr:hypothetical protein [Micromonospora viridifaciens]SCE68742.1 hypothetical protein GA0074695_0312 [Micromonospora viridifaciens]
MSLTRHYRRLLLAYPRAYRRERGEEMIGVLLDRAPAGRTRPTVREAFDLVRGGLRCRLGRPASRTVGVWALLTALICGLFSASLAARLAWETSRPQPDRAEVAAIFAEAFPGHRLDDDSVYIDPALFVFYSQPLQWRSLKPMLFGDGGEYQEGMASASAIGPAPVPETEALATARQRLWAAGWRVYEPNSKRVAAVCSPPCESAIEPADVVLLARQGDTVLRATFHGPSYGSYLGLEVQRATPPAVLPAAVLAGLVGGGLAWLAFAWASRRTEGRRAVRPLFGIAFFLWWMPPLLSTGSLLPHHFDEPHPSWHPLWEWLGQPTGSLLFLVGAACALTVLAVAVVAGRDPEPIPAQVST